MRPIILIFGGGQNLTHHGIYCIAINNKYYIGQTTVSFNHRIQHHLRSLKRGNHANQYLQSAYNKYGDFKFDVIQECDTLDECNKAEIKWIRIYDSLNNKRGYNLNQGGWNGKVSNESKLKMSIAKLGKICSNETRLRMSASHFRCLEDSGYLGITWMKRRQRWRVRIRVGGKRKHIGYFKGLDNAIKLYKMMGENN